MKLDLFAASAPGLEALLAAELAPLGAARAAVTAGGVELEGDATLMQRICLESGLALKLLVRLARFEARTFPELIRRAAAAPWSRWCRPGAAVAIRATAARSRLYHTGAIAERVRAAIAEHLGAAVREPDDGEDREGPAPLTVHVRVHSDVFTLSIDAGGEPLHRRGYRQATAKAPLREDLARALLIVSGWDRASPLCDPFCGAGTILVEADWLARRVPPGHARHFAFEDAPDFDPTAYAALRHRALAEVRDRPPELLGSDRDPGAITAARANATRAAATVELEQAALAVAPGLAPDRWPQRCIATNPPWGQRTGRDRTLLHLYQSLGHRTAAIPRCRVALVTPDLRLAAAAGTRSTLMTDAGGTKIYFCVGGGVRA